MQPDSISHPIAAACTLPGASGRLQARLALDGTDIGPLVRSAHAQAARPVRVLARCHESELAELAVRWGSGPRFAVRPAEGAGRGWYETAIEANAPAFACWALARPDAVEVLKPEGLRQHVIARLTANSYGLGAA